MKASLEQVELSLTWEVPYDPSHPVSNPFWLTKSSELPWKLASKHLNSSPILMKICGKTQFSIPPKREVECRIMCFPSSFKFQVGMRECRARSSFGQRAASLGMTIITKWDNNQNPSQRGTLQSAGLRQPSKKQILKSFMSDWAVHYSTRRTGFHQLTFSKLFLSHSSFHIKDVFPINPAPDSFFLWMSQLNTTSPISTQTFKRNHFAVSRRTKFPLIPANPSHEEKFKKSLTTGTRRFQQCGFGELLNQALPRRTMRQQNSTSPRVFHVFLVLTLPLWPECAHFNFVT